MKAESENILRKMALMCAIAVVDSTRAPVWLTGASGDIAFVNQAFADLTGMKRQQLLGDVWLTLMHPEDAPAVAAQRAAAWSGHAPYEFVARFRDASGA